MGRTRLPHADQCHWLGATALTSCTLPTGHAQRCIRMCVNEPVCWRGARWCWCSERLQIYRLFAHSLPHARSFTSSTLWSYHIEAGLLCYDRPGGHHYPGNLCDTHTHTITVLVHIGPANGLLHSEPRRGERKTSTIAFRGDKNETKSKTSQRSFVVGGSSQKLHTAIKK